MNLRCLTLLALLGAAAAQAGTPDIADDLNARIARSKSQQAAETAQRLREGGAATQAFGAGSGGVTALGKGCSIAIGNVFEDKPRIGTSARRETTVIVTGDIIQVGNNCR